MKTTNGSWRTGPDTLQEFKGQVLFVNFWASWCAPCLAEMPDIHQLYTQTKDTPNLTFLMVSTDQDWEKAQAMIDKKGYDFPIYRLHSPTPDPLQSRSIPATFVVGPDGEIKMRRLGMASYNNGSFLDFLKSLTKTN